MPRNGENIYLRKDGRFEGRYIVGRYENGRTKYASVYGKTKAEVREKMARAMGEFPDAVPDMMQEPFKEVAEKWLASKKEIIAPTSYFRYVDVLEREIYKEYGDTPVKDITEAEIIICRDRVAVRFAKAGKTPSQATIQLYCGVLSQVVAFASGKEKQTFMSEKVSEELGLSRDSYEIFDPQEISRVCKCAKNNKSPEMLAALVALYCGIRPGESAALEWDDISLESKWIYVHQSAHRIKAPKDADSKTILVTHELNQKKQIRHVDIPEPLVLYMKEIWRCCFCSGAML